MPELDLVEGGGRPRSRRTAPVVAVVVALLVGAVVWRIAVGSNETPSNPQSAATQPSQPSAVTASPATVSPTPSPSPSISVEPFVPAADLALWLAQLPTRAERPTTHETLSLQEFRVLHTEGNTGGGDYGAIEQVRDAAGRWIDVARGDIFETSSGDVSGRYVAFAISKANSATRSINNWVYVVSRDDGQVVTRLRIDRERHVAGWLGHRVIVGSYNENGSVMLLDWDRATPVLEDLGLGSTVVGNVSGSIRLVHAGGAGECLGVWRFTPSPRVSDTCPSDQVLGMSPNGRWAITHDLHWVRLDTAASLPVGAQPDGLTPPYGLTARSATFLGDVQALIDLTLDGTNVDATVLCSLHGGCLRVPTRHGSLGLI